MTKKQIKKEIKNITKQLIQQYKPEKIILFGSAVWGKFGPDSDLDFFIVKKKTPYLGVERMRKVRRLIETDMPCNFLIANPDELKERLKLGDPFVKSIIEAGKILYG